MLDYRALAALAAVIETQNFDQAAKRLFITQSAVSQRIQSLEKYYGKPVIIRSLPYEPTEFGKLLLKHYRRACLLDSSFQQELNREISNINIAVAISRDSLETWFVAVNEHLRSLMPFTLEIIADDQELTLDYLNKGLVTACVSTQAKTLPGCTVTFLGFFDYVMVASPDFIKKHFPPKSPRENHLLQAPAIVFDYKDHLHARYLKHFFRLTDTKRNHFVIPSVAGFRQFALKGYAYGLLPKIDVSKELHQKKLINLFPDKIWQMPLYWHQWSFENDKLEDFSERVIKTAHSILRQK